MRPATPLICAFIDERQDRVGLEPVGQMLAQTSSATSKSAVSGKCVAMTETALGELLVADLSGLDLVALMIDGDFAPVSAASGSWMSVQGAD